MTKRSKNTKKIGGQKLSIKIYGHRLNLSLDNQCYRPFFLSVGLIAGVKDTTALWMIIRDKQERQALMGVEHLTRFGPFDSYLMSVNYAPGTMEG